MFLRTKTYIVLLILKHEQHESVNNSILMNQHKPRFKKVNWYIKHYCISNIIHFIKLLKFFYLVLDFKNVANLLMWIWSSVFYWPHEK